MERWGEVERPAAGPPPTILLVDDEPGVREASALVMEALGYAVLPVADPRDALAVLAERPVDLLMTDIVMPGLSGPQLARQARALRPHLPVLLVSAYVPEARDTAPLADAGFLEKPWRPRELAERLRSLLQPDG